MSSPEPSIRFPCHCGHPFEVPADQAASSIQCPKCGRLNDVPSLSDLENISGDGTLLLKPSVPKPEPKRLAQVDRHFAPRRVDRKGNEIDLRNTHDDLADIGAPPEGDQIPLREQDARPAKPKYDPITGELIRPLKIATPPPPEQEKIPVAQRALTYASRDTAHVMNARRIFISLFMPANFVVMIFIFIFYFVFQMTVGLIGFYLFNILGLMPSLYNLPLAFLLMAHYANTVEDNGPESIDELPRPLRNLSFAQDIFGPFSNMFTALAYCFLPAAALFIALPPQIKAVAVLPLALGLFFFPAALLTAITGTTVLNLRPDRLAGVIRISAGQYMVSFFVWLLALPLFAFSLFGVYLIPVQFREDHLWIYQFNRPALAFPVLFLSIIVMHFATWHLGLIYRHHHDKFPWVLQKHYSARREAEAAQAAEVRARRRKPRYVK
ncbi:MAG: hypothetical protein JWN40_2996 [Phycisphaerales bacterium]|nr:hypothetical protein [Phycisphaerales bacterium]